MSQCAKTLLKAAAAGVVGFLACSAGAAPIDPSIAIKFGADQPGRPGDDNGQVNSAAGVLGTASWNNTTGANQMNIALSKDVAGVSSATGATVTFTSNGTWSSTGAGEENNTATGENGDLMGGYLDTGDVGGTGVAVTVNGLDAALGVGPKLVYVYHNGGVIGRGGSYNIAGAVPPSQSYVDAAAFNGTFVVGEDFHVFAVTGDSFTLTTIPVTGAPARAPLNGIEIVAVPEPATLGLLAVGALALTGRRRRA